MLDLQIEISVMTDHAKEALVVFTPSGKRGRFPVGTPLLQAARYLNVDIDSVCGGRGICGRCQILVSEGEFAKFGISVDRSCQGFLFCDFHYARTPFLLIADWARRSKRSLSAF